MDKCNVLISTKKSVGIKIGDYTIDNSDYEKLFGVKIYVNLSFNDDISYVWKLVDISSHSSATVHSIWMCHNYSSNSKKTCFMKDG